MVGGIGLTPAQPGPLDGSTHRAEIGYWLGETFWGRGIASEVLPALTEWAFCELNLVRIEAAVYARNRASARVLEKAGYTFEGTKRSCYLRDGEYIDGLMYAQVRIPR